MFLNDLDLGRSAVGRDAVRSQRVLLSRFGVVAKYLWIGSVSSAVLIGTGPVYLFSIGMLGVSGVLGVVFEYNAIRLRKVDDGLVRALFAPVRIEDWVGAGCPVDEATHVRTGLSLDALRYLSEIVDTKTGEIDLCRSELKLILSTTRRKN